MVRWAAALVLLIACDAGIPVERPYKANRADFDRELGATLPLHGLAVWSWGRSDYRDLELVDLDAETIRVIAESSARGRVEQTLPLAGSDLKRLDDLGDVAWREKPAAIPQQEAALREYLFMADGDEVVEVSGDLIGAGNAVRPGASGLVRAVLDLARETLAELTRPPPPPPAPLVPPKHPHSIARSSLPTAETKTPLPLHGVVVHTWGLGGDQTIVIDADKATIHQISNLVGKPARDQMHEGDATQIDRIMRLAFAAWNEDDSDMPDPTDVREDLYILDGDEAFYLSGHPISSYRGRGRLQAMMLVAAVVHAAR